MKKITTLLMASALLIPSFIFNNEVKAAESEVKPAESEVKEYPSVKEINEMNKALDRMVIEANQKLEEGQTNFVITEKVGEETIKLGFNSEDITPNVMKNKRGLNGDIQTLSSTRQKSYSAYVENTAGFNFSHSLSGQYTYGGGKLNGVTTSVDLSGAMYSETHNTWVDKLDPSVWVVNSHGTFKALKYLMQYNTYISVRILGSGDYRIERAQLSA